MVEEPPLMNVREVADVLQLNEEYVRRLARKGILPTTRVQGVRSYRFRRAEILGWL